MNNAKTSTTLVIGGTGNVGAPLVSLLKQEDTNFSVLVRSDHSDNQMKSQNISTVRGELGQWSDLEDKLQHVDTVFLLSSPTPDMFELHKGFIDLAVARGVRKIVRLSAEPAETGSDMALYDLHGQADDYLIASGLDYVILRPHYFLQNITFMHAQFIKNNNSFAQYLGDAKIPMVDTRDIAKAAFHSLTSDEFNNKIHYITGPRAISFDDVATAFTASLKRDITYIPLSHENQSAGFKAAGLPDWTIDTVMKLFRRWEMAGNTQPSKDFEKITKSTAIDVNQFARDFAGSF